jgi:hypothetical protein
MQICLKSERKIGKLRGNVKYVNFWVIPRRLVYMETFLLPERDTDRPAKNANRSNCWTAMAKLNSFILFRATRDYVMHCCDVTATLNICYC